MPTQAIGDSEWLDWLDECVYVKATYDYETTDTVLEWQKPFDDSKLQTVRGEDLRDCVNRAMYPEKYEEEE